MTGPEQTDSDQPDTAETPEVVAPESAASETSAADNDLETAKKTAAANYDRYMRVAADLENFRRRTVREKEELRLYAASKVLEDLLPIIDNLGLAVAAAKQPNADLKSLTGGVDMVLSQFKTTLSNHGLKEINPAGQAFDPHQHEAISHLPSADVKEENVLTVVRPGFSLNGRLLRPASVVVSSGPAK
jgi:molecular chaperone GrpE